MNLKLHPQISKTRRQSAVEQTSGLLRAYLEHWTDPFRLDSRNVSCTTSPDADADERAASLALGFILPQRHSV
jgi:hypothetical protein